MKFWKNPADKPAFMYSRLATAHYSKSFYLSTLLLPVERRWATFALYGFCRYADNLIDNPRQRTAAELMDEVQNMAAELKLAYRTGESEHPIIRAFMVVAQNFQIPIEYPLDLLTGVQMDLENRRYATFDDLYLFCYRVAGVVGLMMTHVLGFLEVAAFEYAEKLGVAMQLTNILRDIQEDKNMGRIYIPQSELEQFHVREEDILKERMSANLQALIRFQILRAHTYYEEAEKGIRLLNPESRFAIYSASKIYREFCIKLNTNNIIHF
jgi:phytoene synthase